MLNCRLFLYFNVFATLILPAVAGAHEFAARLDVAQWQLEPSPLQCRLLQLVPSYGKATFEKKSGESLNFYLDSDRAAVYKGESQLKIIAPEWRPGISERHLGTANTQKGHRPLTLGEGWANRFIDELKVGMSPAIQLVGWYKGHLQEVALSTVNFQDAYAGYLSCLGDLFPANYQQLKNTKFIFKTNKWGLSQEFKNKLDLIAGYVALDTDVEKIYIDGHTDSVGRRGHNWELSRLRSVTVQKYLEYKGVEPDRIVMRYHGELRPLVKNTSKRNRSKNRRVFINLYKPHA